MILYDSYDISSDLLVQQLHATDPQESTWWRKPAGHGVSLVPWYFLVAKLGSASIPASIRGITKAIALSSMP